jgi:carboxypeptidase PM20D1
MFKKILLGILAILIVVIGIILFKTFRFGKDMPVQTVTEHGRMPDSAVAHLQKAITHKTISWGGNRPTDTSEFMAFKNFLVRTYPLVHSRLSLQEFGGFTNLYKWEGKNSSLPPYVLMAHYDVVPVEEAALSKWTCRPFGGELKDDKVWGRGAVDDKASVIAILEAVEKLLQENFTPDRTVYVSLGHNEEIGGIGGAGEVAKWFRQNNIKPALVLDEGGMITKTMKYTDRPVALISTAEKGYMSFELKVEQAGGHSSQPKQETAIDVLNKALVNLRKLQMPVHFTEPVEEMFLRLGKQMPFKERMAFANRWLFEKMIAKAAESDGQQNALFHTTLVPTLISAGIKDNVIPSVATAIVNCRLLPGETLDNVEAFMKKQMADERVAIRRLNDEFYNAPTITSFTGKGFQHVEALVYKTVKDVLPVPFQLMGTTDSRHFQDISEAVIRFTPFTDVKGYHGIDEHIELADFRQMIFFYTLFLKEAS